MKKIIKWSRIGEYTVFTDKYVKPNFTLFDYDELRWLFNLLDDEYSKTIFVKVIVYRLLGKNRVRLPLNNQNYWKQRKDMMNMQVKNAVPIKVDFMNMNWELSLFDLSKSSFDIKIYATAIAVQTQFYLKHYEYNKDGVEIKAEKNDFVIDAGSCWGDTTLYFAHEVGSNGMVYSFESNPDNLEILKKNILLNSNLKKRIKVVQKPLWEHSNKALCLTDEGPASRVCEYDKSDVRNTVSTIAIDDFVQSNAIKKIDLIKMDIEGAELNALKGAENTINKFKPKLVISVYHKPSDFFVIPQFINSLNLGYKFYLDHHTIHAEETVLFAK